MKEFIRMSPLSFVANEIQLLLLRAATSVLWLIVFLFVVCEWRHQVHQGLDSQLSLRNCIGWSSITFYKEDIGCRGGLRAAVGLGFVCKQVTQLLM